MAEEVVKNPDAVSMARKRWDKATAADKLAVGARLAEARRRKRKKRAK